MAQSVRRSSWERVLRQGGYASHRDALCSRQMVPRMSSDMRGTRLLPPLTYIHAYQFHR